MDDTTFLADWIEAPALQRVRHAYRMPKTFLVD
jgi:hypothetical protein